MVRRRLLLSGVEAAAVRVFTTMEPTIVDIHLPGHPESVNHARSTVAQAMADDARVGLVADVVLVVSELVANAVTFTTRGCTLRVGYSGVGSSGMNVLVEVDDCDDVNPQRRTETDRQPGHGLGVVQELADTWGIGRLDAGKCVWAELSEPRDRRVRE